ncbi:MULTISPECIES: phasin family protein [Methylobacterium]|uniref:phasin family protein n=1 Tax=Methylobacterium TaxID=407 RepID=UPI0009EB26BF|nr:MULTISPECIES: phasin family protein [Methylobacterium]MCI9882718.1 phasin family protein [Methylobacterium goesingense]
MSQVYEKAAEMNKTGLATVMKSVSSLAKTNQTAGIEMADFAKESYSAGAEAMKKLAAARTLQSALEIQADYLKAFYERFQSQAKVMTDLYQGLAQEIGAPLQAKAPFDMKTFFDSKAFFDPKTFFDPKAFDLKSFPKLPGFPAAEQKAA